MSANFFVAKDDAFVVVLPIDCTDPENPQIIFVDGIEQYPAKLQAIPEEHLEYHFCRFRRPDWGLDCYVRELAYDGSTIQTRVFSQEKLDEVRLRYFLLGCSFFPADNPISFSKEGAYDILATTTEERVKRISPFILRIFILIAGRVWDLGYPIRHLLTADDYRTLRNDPNGLRVIAEAKGLINRAITNPDDPMVKKNLTNEPVKASSAAPNPEKTAGSASV